jgi:hypothetical protein
MTSISPTSMIRTDAFAIGLSNYSQPVMPTRTIALPAVSKTLAQAPRSSRGEVRLCRGRRDDREAPFARPSSAADALREL